MTNIDARLVGWGIDPKYMSENEKINKIYDKGFDKGLNRGLQNAIDTVLEIIDDMCRDDETGMRIDLGIQWLHAKTVREKIAALKEGEQK